jgi:hypothetical protein
MMKRGQATMEPINNLETLPVVWQYVGSIAVLVVTSGIAIYGWVKKNNPFERATPVTTDTVVVSAEIASEKHLLRLVEAAESENRKLERIYGRLSDIYEEQERTNRLLKELLK